MTGAEFSKGRVEVPWFANCDTYTAYAAPLPSAELKQRAVFNVTNRRSPRVAFPALNASDKMVFYGLSDFIRNHLTRPLTNDQIDSFADFHKSAHAIKGGLPFAAADEMWRSVVDEFGGYLPLRIDALPEGSTFYPNEPFIQVQSLGNGYGPIAVVIEALMLGVVSNTVARLTMERYLYQWLVNRAKENNPSLTQDAANFQASIMIHDFGMRGCFTGEESEIGGRAHLLCFQGTDNWNAALQAWTLNNHKPVGSSIPALAHWIVQSHQKEEEAYNAITLLAMECDVPIASYVADCYDFHRAVREFLVPLAANNDVIVVARPDSGDYLENILFICDQAVSHGLVGGKTPNGLLKGGKLRFIQGDSMDFHKIKTSLDALQYPEKRPPALIEKFPNLPALSAFDWGIFGVGGWLRNGGGQGIANLSRDTLSTAYKLAAVGNNYRPVVKLSDTLAKMSVPGPTRVVRGTTPTVWINKGNNEPNAYVNFYDASKSGDKMWGEGCLEEFDTVRNRVIKEFDNMADSVEVLSPEILEIQREVLKANGRDLESFSF